MTPEMDRKTPIDRLNYTGDLRSVISRVCAAYDVGTDKSFSIVPVGYEDCNVIVDADRGKFLAKIFAKTRKPEEITRYSTIMEKTVAAGVHHPPLLHTQDARTVYTDSGLSLVLMQFIEGRTFLDLDRAPNDEECKAVIGQAALVNRIDYHPPYLFDSWAIPNIKVMFDKTKQFIKPDDLKLVEAAMARYGSIPVDRLPHAFVHGDFTKANVLKSQSGDIYILDLSVANWYPRIQELAVIAANLMHDNSSKTSLKEKTEIVADQYNALNPLTSEERASLYDYALAGVAMEFMGSHQEKYINGNDTKETEYWFNLGREGLRSILV